MKPPVTRFLSELFLLLPAVLLSNILCGDSYAQKAGQAAARPEAAKRVVMTECEGIDNCTTWTFLSAKGYGKWRTGEEAVLEVKSVHADQIVILRTDVMGSKSGLTATYEGTLSDGELGGNYSYSYNGKSGSGRWYAILGTSAATLPTVMHFCAQWCATLTLENGKYNRTAGGCKQRQLHGYDNREVYT